MSCHRCAAILLLSAACLFVFGCDHDSPGFIVVTVTDSQAGSVDGFEIQIFPSFYDLIAITDDQGVARFEVEPGDYFVDASVPGPGPAPRKYHVPITVHGGETVPVQLYSCFSCV